MTTEARVRVVGAEEAPRLAQQLAGLLVDCVDGGASVSFMAPLEMQKAVRFWTNVADDVARGDRILLIAEVSGRIVGTIQIVVGQPENQPHRADVSKLLVHSDFRRHGVGSRLMAQVDVVAARAGKTLLVLDTETSSDAERLYARAGWTRAGVIPDYALKPYGGLTATTLFYKRLPAPGQETHTIEPARQDDVAAIKAMIDGAYSKYIDRMGRLPAPMSADYAGLAASGDLYVLRAHGAIAGAVLLTQDQDSIKINNLVVGPAEQGKGYGRELMLFAERLARSKKLPALTLFTNALMHENIALYTKTGFVITDRRSEAGFDRVYFRKQLD